MPKSCCLRIPNSPANTHSPFSLRLALAFNPLSSHDSKSFSLDSDWHRLLHRIGTSEPNPFPRTPLPPGSIQKCRQLKPEIGKVALFWRLENQHELHTLTLNVQRALRNRRCVQIDCLHNGIYVWATPVDLWLKYSPCFVLCWSFWR